MVTFLYQASYSPAALQSLVAHPQDRTAAIQGVVDAVGGKLHGCWLALGTDDLVVIAEAEDDTAMAAIAMAVAATGAVVDGHTTRLMSFSDGERAMQLAQKVSKGYTPPTG